MMATVADEPAVVDVPAEGMPIVRDSTFARFVADRGIINDLGRDLEISFLQYGSILKEAVDKGEWEEIRKDSVITEVARLRIGFAAMVNLAMTFLNGGIMDGKLKGEAVLTSVQEWVEAANKEELSDNTDVEQDTN